MTAQTIASIDPEELAFYTRLADQWWNEDGPFWPLHLLNRLRSAWIIERLGLGWAGEQCLTGLRVLDIGCGGGLLADLDAL